MTTITVGIIGDYDPESPSHRATDAALHYAADHLGITMTSAWLPTSELEDNTDERLDEFDALWCAPGSPYRSMHGALAAIRVARASDRPFLGTCGGFQHAVIEYARNVLNLVDAQHAEYDPYASRLVITPLSCSLVGREMRVRIAADSLAFRAYGSDNAVERYYCNFGLNPDYQSLLEQGGLRIVGVDEDQGARIVELPTHCFYIATLFVPQVSSTPEKAHPLILAYLDAARQSHLSKRGHSTATARTVR